MLGPTLALGIPGALAVAGFLYLRRMERTGPVSVVDRRTLRLAERRIAAAEAAGDTRGAAYAMHGIEQYLRGEIHSGPARKRVRRAAELEQWQLRRQQLGDY
jgi:hypothetical protein